MAIGFENVVRGKERIWSIYAGLVPALCDAVLFRLIGYGGGVLGATFIEKDGGPCSGVQFDNICVKASEQGTLFLLDVDHGV